MTLQRLTGKVFAGNADLTDLGVFGSALSGTPTNPTGTNTEAQIQADEAYEEGWTDAVVTTKNFPPIEEVNGVLRTISYQTCYLLQEGIPVWDANTEYSNTSVVKVINGQQLDFYISQKTQSGNIPQSDDGTNWKKAIITGDREIGVPQITLDFDMDLPDGYIDLIGQEEAIDGKYSALYPIFLDYYGIPETAGNFVFPDFRGRALYGGASAGYINQGLPDLGLATVSNGLHSHSNSVTTVSNHTHTRGTMNITGRFGVVGKDGAVYTGAFYKYGDSSKPVSNSGENDIIIGFDASKSWTGATSGAGSHSHTVTINNNGSHSHAITHNGIIGSSDKIYTDGIKIRVFTRYK